MPGLHSFRERAGKVRDGVQLNCPDRAPQLLTLNRDTVMIRFSSRAEASERTFAAIAKAKIVGKLTARTALDREEKPVARPVAADRPILLIVSSMHGRHVRAAKRHRS